MAAAGISDGFDLGEYHAAEHGVAVVPGRAFSLEGNEWVRFSYALPPEVTRGALDRFDMALKALK